jgi:hypothetical protein
MAAALELTTNAGTATISVATKAHPAIVTCVSASRCSAVIAAGFAPFTNGGATLLSDQTVPP